MADVKVLVVGPVLGQFEFLFKKISTVNGKNGPFDLLLCTGSFFSEAADDSLLDQLLGGKYDVAIPTYFIAGETPLPQAIVDKISDTGGEICHNVTYLGDYGTLKTAGGIRIAYLSGIWDYKEDEEEPTETSRYNDKIIEHMLQLAEQQGPADILVTNEWSSNIRHLSERAQTLAAGGSEVQQIAKLAHAFQPRYHFSQSSLFFEREPYYNSQSSDTGPRLSRFLSLSTVNNSEKQKWLYAFNLKIQTAMDMPTPAPANTTPSPFDASLENGHGRKRKHEDDGSNFFWGGESKAKGLPPNYVCKICNNPGHHIRDCPMSANQRRETGSGRVPPDGYICHICNQPGHFIKDCPEKSQAMHPTRKATDTVNAADECWFCLANPKVTKHLIVSIGNEAYLTLPKGGLLPPDSGIPGGGHVLLIPISHYASLRNMPVEAQVDVVAELEQYKSSLRKFYDRYDYDMVVFEVSREFIRGQAHAHLQIIPIPKSIAPQLRAHIIEEGKAQGKIQFKGSLPDNITLGYLKIDLPDGESLVHIIKPNERFNVQFGRVVLASILGLQDRSDWKACSRTDEEEKEDAAQFKAAFQKFDFTLT